MYLVTLENDGVETQIHNYQANRALPKLAEGTVVLGAADEIESCNFTVYPDNPGYDLLHPLTTRISVWSSTTKKTIFRGRVLTVAPAMDSGGLISKSVVCEGEKGYLCDSIQPYTSERHWTGDESRTGLEEFIDYLLANHNAQVEDYKKIYRGTVTVDPFATSDDVTKGTDYETTWECIKEKLMGSFGGEIQLRLDDEGLLRLDYVPRLGQTRETEITLGHNLQSITKTVDPTALCTRLIPLGARLENSDARVTIESVNGGRLYLENATARAEYGLVTKVQTWDEVTEPAYLLSKATDWFQTATRATESYSVTALNLYEIGLAPDDIQRFDSYPVRAESLGINTILRCEKVTLDLVDPTASTVDMGDTPVTASGLYGALSESVAQKPTQAQMTSALSAAILAVTQAITGNAGGYVVQRPAERPEELLILDSPNLEEAKNVWRWNLAGLGHSSTGVDGPYTLGLLADGSVNAELVRVGTMLADRIRGGTLTLGGLENGNGSMILLDKTGAQCGVMDNEGIRLTGEAGQAQMKDGRMLFQGDGEGDSNSTVNHSEFRIMSSDNYILAWLSNGGKLQLGYSGMTEIPILLDGKTGSGAFSGPVTQGSDRRLKDNITELSDAHLSAFQQLRPCEYRLKASGKRALGLIAQDILGTALEDVLVVRRQDGYLHLDYTSLHALEIRLIQKLMNQVENLERRGEEKT